MNILVITSEWPTPEHPEWVPFIVRQVESLRRAAIHVNVYPFRGAGRPANYYKTYRQVHRLLAEHKYDLVHAHSGQGGIVSIWPKMRPLVVTYHGSDLEGIVNNRGRYTLAGYVLRIISKIVAHYADEIIVVSERLAKHLPNRPYHVIPSGIDLDLFHPIPQREARRQLSLSLDEAIVLFVGDSANPVKRYRLAEQVVSEVDGRLKARLLNATGVPHEQMPLYMNAADALLLTSLHEGSPGVVKEAMACNLPVVSLDVGDVRERIGKVKGCALCTDDSPAAIASALAEVLQSRSRVNSRPGVVSLDEAIVATRLIGVYQQALTSFGA